MMEKLQTGNFSKAAKAQGESAVLPCRLEFGRRMVYPFARVSVLTLCNGGTSSQNRDETSRATSVRRPADLFVPRLLSQRLIMLSHDLGVGATALAVLGRVVLTRLPILRPVRAPTILVACVAAGALVASMLSSATVYSRSPSLLACDRNGPLSEIVVLLAQNRLRGSLRGWTLRCGHCGYRRRINTGRVL